MSSLHVDHFSDEKNIEQIDFIRLDTQNDVFSQDLPPKYPDSPSEFAHIDKDYALFKMSELTLAGSEFQELTKSKNIQKKFLKKKCRFFKPSCQEFCHFLLKLKILEVFSLSG